MGTFSDYHYVTGNITEEPNKLYGGYVLWGENPLNQFGVFSEEQCSHTYKHAGTCSRSDFGLSYHLSSHFSYCDENAQYWLRLYGMG